MCDNAELMDILKTNFLMKYNHNYSYAEINEMSMFRRTIEIQMLQEKLEEDRKNQQKQNRGF